jgi:plastocyanin
LKTKRLHQKAISRAAGITIVLIVIIVVIGAVAITYVIVTAGNSTVTTTSSSNSIGQFAVNEAPVNHYITVTWEKSPQALQDRFTPFNIIVAQGDIIHITFITNDSAGHTFTISSPYNFQINDTVKGQTNDLTGKIFTTNSTSDSLGVAIRGSVGNVTGTGSFVAKYAGIFEYFCVYHVQLGMFGYLVVLPNAAYASNSTVTSSTTSLSSNSSNPQIVIEPGSGTNATSVYYSPTNLVVVIGVNNTVTWVNNDDVPHTATADNGSFNSGSLNPGQSYTYTFTTPGTFTYHCNYHPWMRGTIVVKAA